MTSHAFVPRPLVLKLGGELLEDRSHRATVVQAVRTIASRTLPHEPVPLIIVHGGGKEIDARLKAARLKGSTKYTLTDKAKLRSIILKGRADGYCMTRQEATIGHCAIAVPLRRVDGRAIGALSIPALAEHVAANAGIMNTFLRVLRDQVEALSKQLI